MTQVVEADSIAAELAAIWQRARPTVLARLEAIEKAAAALSAGSLSAEERLTAKHESHKLAGISGTLGFPNVTTYAREAETLLEGTAALDASQIGRLNELVLLSRAEFDSARAGGSVVVAGSATALPSPLNARVELYAFEPELATTLQAVAERYDIDVVPQSEDQASETSSGSGHSCDVCIVRIASTSGDVDGIRRVRDRYPDVPIVVWTDDESFAHRVECVRAGAQRIVSGAASLAALLHSIHAILPKLGGHRGVVLAAGVPSSLFGDLLAPVRASNGLIIQVEPAAILSALRALPSAVVLIGEDEAATNALDVCRVIRADAVGAAITIMLLEGAEARPEKDLQDVGAIGVKSLAIDVAERLRPFLGGSGASGGTQPEGRKKTDGATVSTPEHVDVAIVDDDELITMLVEDALNAAGYSYRVIRDGVSASAALAGRVAPLTATVILLDLGLPGQDGFSVLRALRQTGVTKTSSVVVLTGRSEQAEVVQALQLGASAYVVKPFVIADLMVRVRSAIKSRVAA